MPRASRLAAALCALVLVAAACGDDDDGDTATTDAAAVTTVDAATTPSSASPTTDAPETTATTETTVDVTTPATDAATTTPETVPALGSIVDVAGQAGTFTTLLAAADAAGLTEELSTREVTLLAPTDDAFAALGQGTLDALLADPVALATVLRNHMLPVPQTADAIVLFSNLLTVDGGSLDVVRDGETITVGGARILTPDIEADNGIIHAIDTVLVPPAPAG